MKRWAALLLAVVLAQPLASAKVVEDRRYKFRVDLPGVVSDKVEEFGARGGALSWRAYTSSSRSGQAAAYTAAVKVFDTDSSDVRVLFEAGENDASQALGVPLVGRRDGTFGAGKLPSLTLSYQIGRGGADTTRAKVLLVVKGKRLYQLTFSFTGATDRAAIGDRFFRSFAILQ
jgi:hypothetical protein